MTFLSVSCRIQLPYLSLCRQALWTLALCRFLIPTLSSFAISIPSTNTTGEQLASSSAPNSASVARVVPISFAFGMSILCQAYSFGHISGGHFNPAVTLCLFLLGECDVVQTVCYIVAQLVGATFGSLLLWASVSSMNEDRKAVVEQVIGDPPFALGANGLNSAIESGNGFMLEFMGTMVLCMTVCMTAVHPKSLSKGTPHMAPLAIGFAVFLAHLVLVPLTGCGINPARTFGPALVNSLAGSNVWDDSYWIYFIGPFTASVVAAVIFKFIFAEDEGEAAAEAPVDKEPTKEVEVAAGGEDSSA